MDLTSQEPALLDFFCVRACISMCVQGRNQQQAMEGRGRAECIHCGRRCKVFLEGRRGVGGGCGRVSWRSGAVSGADAAGSPGAAALHRGRSGADAAALHRGRSDRVTQSPRVLYTI